MPCFRRAQLSLLCFLALHTFGCSCGSRAVRNASGYDVDRNLRVLTVSLKPTDGYMRFAASANYYNIQVEVLGRGLKWHRLINRVQLKKALERDKDNYKKIIFITSSDDVIFLKSLSDVTKCFATEFTAKIIFGTRLISPIKSKSNKHISKEMFGKLFTIDENMFMGYAPYIYKMLDYKDAYLNDQDYYSSLYTNETIRSQLQLDLDLGNVIFQNFDYGQDEVIMTLDKNVETFIRNTRTVSEPIVLRGTELSKINLNSFGNYLGGIMYFEKCYECDANNLNLTIYTPEILISIYIEENTPFLEEFFESIMELNYRKDHLHVYIINHDAAKDDMILAIMDKMMVEYASVNGKFEYSYDSFENESRERAIKIAEELNVDYLFVVDGVAHLTEPNVLKVLVQLNKTVISPLLTYDYTTRSNFWGALSSNGYYARSNEYEDIVHKTYAGIWNVPHIESCYLIKSSVFHKITYIDYDDEFNVDHRPNLVFSKNLLKHNIFMMLANFNQTVGELLKNDYFDPTRIFPELFEVEHNPILWSDRYANSSAIEQTKDFLMVCPDVYHLPILKERFCNELFAIIKSETVTGNIMSRWAALNQVNVTSVDDLSIKSIWSNVINIFVDPKRKRMFANSIEEMLVPHSSFILEISPMTKMRLITLPKFGLYTAYFMLRHEGSGFENDLITFPRQNCSVGDIENGSFLVFPSGLTHPFRLRRYMTGTTYLIISSMNAAPPKSPVQTHNN